MDLKTGTPYRVLSLDGGGIRGLYTTALLQQLAVRIARLNGSPVESKLDLGAKFDLIVGTSTGSIIAVALAAGVCLEDVLNLYRNKASAIFQKPMPLQDGCFGTVFKTFRWGLSNTLNAANGSAALAHELGEVLKDETLGQLFRRRRVGLCIPTIDAESQKAWVFKTPHGSRLTRDDNYRLVDVCMASAAAPIYFPMHPVASPNPGATSTHLFVDGGLWANNPVLVGLVEALEFADKDRPIEILSVGTCSGNKARVLDTASANRGSLQWKGGVDIVGLSMEAQASVVPYLAEQMVRAMGGRVTLHRLREPEISAEEKQHLALDAVDKRSLSVLEMLAQRATDLNMSALTNSGSQRPEYKMALDMFSNLSQLPERT